jgi:hypothetical protein
MTEQIPVDLRSSAPCLVCGYHDYSEWETCPHCNRKRGDGAHPMGFMMWFLLILTIPIYPIAGSAALVAALAVAGLGYIPGFPQIATILLMFTMPVIAYTYAFKVEQQAAFSRTYRIARYVLRWATGFAAIYFAMFGDIGLSGADMFGVIVVVPLAILLTKLADIALDVRGPIPPEKPMGRFKTLMYELKWNEAIIWGFPFGVLGGLMGRDAAILFGLLAWAFVTIGILAVKLLFMMLVGGLQIAGKAAGQVNRGLGGVPSRFIWGIGLGAGAGVVLGQLLDGRVQIEAVIFCAIIGLIVTLIGGAFRKRAAKS